VYFVQAAIYSTIRGLSLPYTNAWPLLFLATLLFMGLAARLWCQLDGNRYFTVGISAVVDAERVGMAQAPMPVSSDA
jgi:hypothetical protein